MLIPILISAGQVIVGSVFLRSAFSKLRDIEGARIGVLDYRLVPAWIAAPVAVGLGVFELLTGGGLVLGSRVAAYTGVVLLLVVSLAAASALLRGLKIECHCAGEGQKLTWWTLARNAVFGAGLFGVLLVGANDPPLAPAVLLSPLTHVFAVGVTIALIAALYSCAVLVRLMGGSRMALRQRMEVVNE